MTFEKKPLLVRVKTRVSLFLFRLFSPSGRGHFLSMMDKKVSVPMENALKITLSIMDSRGAEFEYDEYIDIRILRAMQIYFDLFFCSNSSVCIIDDDVASDLEKNLNLYCACLQDFSNSTGRKVKAIGEAEKHLNKVRDIFTNHVFID